MSDENSAESNKAVMKPKKARRSSLSNTGKVLGRSLKKLMKKSTGKSDTSTKEDTARTSESDSNPASDQGSTADTSLTMTPPREKALVMEGLEDIVAPMIDAVEEAIHEAVEEVEAVVEEQEQEPHVPAEESVEDESPVSEPDESSANKDEESEEDLQGEDLVEDTPAVVPVPPSVPRNDDLLELLNEANIMTDDVEDEDVHRMVEEAALELDVIDEPASETVDPEAESILASQVRDSFAKLAAKQDTSSAWSPTLITMMLVGVVVVLLCFEENMAALTSFKAYVFALFEQAEEVPQEVVRQVRPLKFVKATLSKMHAR